MEFLAGRGLGRLRMHYRPRRAAVAYNRRGAVVFRSRRRYLFDDGDGQDALDLRRRRGRHVGGGGVGIDRDGADLEQVIAGAEIVGPGERPVGDHLTDGGGVGGDHPAHATLVPPWFDTTPSTMIAMSTTEYAAPAAVHWMPPLVLTVTIASSGTFTSRVSPGIVV
jgi:hypothetical protein